MDFKIIADLFENLSLTSKRLNKILILRDFLEEDIEQRVIVFDLISSNFYRQLGKKNLGISLKTILQVISFISNSSEKQVEKSFNKVGDVGIVSQNLISTSKQESLLNSKLTLKSIISALKQIKTISGNNSNKKKKEILSKLFLSASSSVEYKFLARLLIDDLRVGVSVGVLKEACVNVFFPKVLGVHGYCDDCDYFSISTNNCIKCSKKLDFIYVPNKYKLIEIGVPKEETGLNKFIPDMSFDEKIKFILRHSGKNVVLKVKNPREFYNDFLKIFERKYNLINNFKKVLIPLIKDFSSIAKAEIKLGTPIKSMLGVRTNSIDSAFEVAGKPCLVDYKYDGLRVQIHNNFGKVQLFSRNLDDITSQFSEVVDYIKLNFSDLNFVCDSECIAFDYNSGKFLDFQILSRRILSKNINEVSHINVIVKLFDIMYLNNKTLIDLPYSKRREKLLSILINRKLKQKLNFDISKLNKVNSNFKYD